MQPILSFCRKIKTDLKLSGGKVIEVGSRDVNGSAREVFASSSYLGIDSTLGNCVDVVMDGEKIGEEFPRESFDTALCFECLEHCLRPWVIVEGLKKVLRPGGYLWVSTPTFGFPLHKYPLDCWRLGEDAYRGWLFADMDLLALETVNDAMGWPAIVGVGRKRQNPEGKGNSAPA